jgi:hypothetical protein
MDYTEEELKNEIWKDIPEYECLYQVSDLGRIKSLERYVKNRENGFRKVSERILKLASDKDGYKLTILSNCMEQTCKKVHRLVLLAFQGSSNLQVDHINGIKDDNRLINLRYCTNRENLHFYVKDNSKHLLGVSLSKEGTWVSAIKINNVYYYLGKYRTERLAHNKYNKALTNWLTMEILPEPYVNLKNSSKYKYISFHSRDKKWTITYKRKHYGYFLTEEEAYKKLLTIIEE